MSPADEALARRAVAAPGWRWLPGMLTLPFYEDGPGSHVCYPPWRVKREGVSGPFTNQANNDAPPDFRDPATLGCLLALVREAWGGDPRTCVQPSAQWHRGEETWIVYAYDQSDPRIGYRDVSRATSEAEALVAALEAAPRSTP